MTAASADLVAELRKRGVTDVDDSTLARALYSSDASLYRVVPQVVVRPRARGRAGRDPRRRAGHRRTGHHARRRHLDRRQRGRPGHRRRHRQAPRPGRLDRPRGTYRGRPARRRARQPAARGRAARPPLRPGPVDPHPLHDRRDDRQQRLRVAGARLRPDRRQRGRARTSAWGPGRHASVEATARRRWCDQHLAHIRTEFGRFSRQVSGYSLEHLLPEHGASSTGSWSARRAPSRVVLRGDRAAGRRRAADRLLVVLGYPSMAEAADAVPALLAAADGGWSPARGWTRGSSTWCGRRGARCRSCRRAPAGCSSRSPAPRRRRWRHGRSPRAGALGHRLVTDAAEAAALWRIREDGAGLAARSLKTPGVLRLGGRRGPAGAARRLAARLRRAAAASTASTACPTATSATAACTCGSTSRSQPGDARLGEGLPRLPHRLRAQAARPPRLAVRRARRRPGALRAAPADVRRGVDRGCSPRSRRSATRATCSTPATWSTRRRWTPTCARSGPGSRCCRCSSSRTTVARWATRCTAAPASASASRRRPPA